MFESGVASPVQKVYESEDTLTLAVVASGTGSVDSFVIEKKTGKFARVAVGSVAGLYAEVALMLVGSDQDKSLSLWGNSEEKRFFLALEWQFLG